MNVAKNDRAQIMVELALWLTVMSALLAGLVRLDGAIQSRMRVLDMTRLAMKMCALPGVSDQQIEAELMGLSTQIRVRVFPVKETAASRFFNLKKIVVVDKDFAGSEVIVVHKGDEKI